MNFYTKEWYALMQSQFYTSGMQRIPDKVYSDKEIRQFYDKRLEEEIVRDRKIHNTPRSFAIYEKRLQTEPFNPEDWVFVDEETEEWIYPQSVEQARALLEKEKKQAEERFANRPPFDPTETIECFRQCYKSCVRHAASNYPSWVGETVDKRLLALWMLPEGAYKRLKKEEQKNRKTFDKIEQAAKEVLSNQDIPKEISAKFRFHDANVLAIRRVRSDVELCLRKVGGWPEDTTPYIKIIFKHVSVFDREKGLVLRTKADEDGEKSSNCRYLYDELYRTENGYEIHMLLWTMKDLRYLTIGCEDISFEDNIEL